MRIISTCLLVFLFSGFQMSSGQTLDEMITQAQTFFQGGNLEQAVKVMETAIQQYPESATAYSYLGLYRGTQAGRTQNYMEAGRLIGLGYDMLDKAIALDPNNPIARFNRGTLSVNVPPFMGKLDEGIQDLELLSQLQAPASEKVSPGLLAQAYSFLAKAYEQKNDSPKVVIALKKVIDLAPNSDLAKNAGQKIASLTQPQSEVTVTPQKYTASDVQTFKRQAGQEPTNPEVLVKLGKAYYDTGDFQQANDVLRKAIQMDSTQVAAYKLLIATMGELASKGYDERIYQDTDFRTKIAFEMVKLTEKAVALAPTDPELRLRRGNIGVMMPFFVGKLDQAMQDLNWVTQSNASQEIKAEAFYWLGFAYQKKATTNWIKVVTDFKNTPASQFAFQSMRPGIQSLDPQKYPRPFVAIDFILGFRDELAPQTAVWIEDSKGAFVATIYVSGFSGHAREKQVNLGSWAKSSNYRGADAVTSASIDLGHHIYIWDLKDHRGQKVAAGSYRVKVEVAYWPSMEYQLVAATIDVGKKAAKTVVTEGNLISTLTVQSYVE